MFKGILKVIISYSLMLFSLLLMISLVKFSPNDLVFYTTAVNSSYMNMLGVLGVQIASPFVFFYGYSSWIWVLFSLWVGIRILVGITPRELLIRFALVHGVALLSSVLFSLFTSNFSFLTGGVFGALLAHILTSVVPSFIMIPLISALLVLLLTRIWAFPFEQLTKILDSLNKTSQAVAVTEQGEEYKDELPQENFNNSELRIPINDIIEEIPQSYQATRDEDMHYGAVDSLTEELEPSNFRYQSQLPSFLQEINEEESSEFVEPVFICKKPLVTKKETLLREVEVDLLSPYLRGSSSFYDKIEENNFLKSRSLEVLESSTLVEDVQNIVEGLDELDQSFESMLPTSEWVKETGVPLSDFIRTQPKVKRLSFDEGIVSETNEVNNVLETQVSPDENEDTFNSDKTFDTTSLLDDVADKSAGSMVHDLINESAEIVFNAEPPTIPQHISNFPPVSSFISDTPFLLNELDDDGQELPAFSLEHFDFSNHDKVDNDATVISDSEKMLLSGVERTMKRQQDSTDSLKEKLQKKQLELANAYYKKLEQEENAMFSDEEPITFLNETPSPLISNFILQDFEKEILALKNESNVLDTLSQDISDDNFLMTHESLLGIEPAFDPLGQTPINNTILSEDSSPAFDPLGQAPIDNTVLSENIIDSEQLIQELMIPNVEGIQDIENTHKVDYTESPLTTDPIEEIKSNYQIKEDLKIEEEYTTPQFASLIRLDLGEVDLPDITELTGNPLSLDDDKNGTILQFKDIISQKDELGNDVDNMEEHKELSKDPIKEETNYLLSEESLDLTPMPVEDIVHSFSSELESDSAFVISTNDDDNFQDNDFLQSDVMEETLEPTPSPVEDKVFSFSSEESEREPEFVIRNINDDEELNKTPPLESAQKIVEPTEVLEQQTIVPEEIFVQDSLELTKIDLMDQGDSIDSEETIVFEEPIIQDILEEESRISEPAIEEIVPIINKEDEEPKISELAVEEIISPIEKDEEPIILESISEEMLHTGVDQKDMILNNEAILSDDDSNEIHETEKSLVDQDITDLDTPEALLMPSVTTDLHLIKTVKYPVAEQTLTPKLPKEAIFPNIEDLEPNTDTISKAEEDEEVETTMKMIEDTYESFNINMQVVDFNRGPTITRFELEPPSGLKLRTILNLQDDLALQAGTSNLRIISPVEGRSLIGIEVPNKVRRNFLLREQIESNLFEDSQAELPLILGIDVGGKEIVSDLATTPHLLIAGTTGSGKSVYVNALIMGLLFKLSSEDLKFIMIDPKMVELELYGGIPHLLAPIITKPEEAMAALEWTVQEMDRRYKILSELSVRNIKEYKNLGKNSPTGDQGYEKLPYIVVIVDEFANLMLRAPKDTEKHISRLASMSRAVGIHLVLATQRPSVDVVTGIIKANFPSRIAFRVSSKIDSRTIIDRNGAETLLGRGDMLFMSPNYMDPVRIQSPYASSEDVARAVNTIKKNGPPDYAIDFSEVLAKQEENNSDGSRTDAMSDPLFEEVLRYAVDNGEISASGIQRRFRVGYNRASRLIESMKDMKIISPPPSAGKGWQINITRDEIQSYLD